VPWRSSAAAGRQCARRWGWCYGGTVACSCDRGSAPSVCVVPAAGTLEASSSVASRDSPTMDQGRSTATSKMRRQTRWWLKLGRWACWAAERHRIGGVGAAMERHCVRLARLRDRRLEITKPIFLFYNESGVVWSFQMAGRCENILGKGK